MGLFKAIIDAMLGEADALAGQSVTKLTADLAEDEGASPETGDMFVESNVRFGRTNEEDDDALVLINGEVIKANTRPDFLTLSQLTRGVGNTKVRRHPKGSLVYDLSGNRTAVDLARRGLFVRTSIGDDLDVIGRNHGLHKCPGLTEAQWRELIEVMAYLPNQPIDAIERVLNVYPGVGAYEIVEDLVTDPNVVTVRIILVGGSVLQRGKFFLNGGYELTVNGASQVVLPFAPSDVLGVYYANDVTRNGKREGQENIYSSYLGSTVSLTTGTSSLLSQNVDPGDTEIRVVAPGFFPDIGPYSVQLVDGAFNEIVTVLRKESPPDAPYTRLVIDPTTLPVNTYAAGPGTAQRVVNPGDAVIVDACHIKGHYLAVDETQRYPTDGSWFPYLSDPSAIVTCLLNQVRAAGVRVNFVTVLS